MYQHWGQASSSRPFMVLRNAGTNNLSVVASNIRHSSSFERMLLRQMLFEGNLFEAKYRKIDFASIKKLGSSFLSIDITSSIGRIDERHQLRATQP
jgi:hypothetical protein